MKGSRAEWLILAALLVVLVGASILVGAQGESEGPELAPDPSTYNARGSGSKGLFVWLQELGVNVRRWERPLEDLPEEARVLLVLGPRRLLDGGELAAVERWVRAGGVLCLADSAVGRAVPGVLPGPAALKFGLRPRFAGGPATLRPACQKSRVALGSSAALRSCSAERTAYRVRNQCLVRRPLSSRRASGPARVPIRST